MELYRTRYSMLRILSILVALLGIAATVLYFWSLRYGLRAASTPYLWAAIALNSGMIVLYSMMLVLARPLPPDVRKRLRSCLWVDLVVIAAQIVLHALVIACEAGLLPLSIFTVKDLDGYRIGDWTAFSLLFHLEKYVKPALVSESHMPMDQP